MLAYIVSLQLSSHAPFVQQFYSFFQSDIFNIVCCIFIEFQFCGFEFHSVINKELGLLHELGISLHFLPFCHNFGIEVGVLFRFWVWQILS